MRALRFPQVVVLALSGVLCGPGTARAGGGAATDSYDDVRRGVVLDFHTLVDLYVLGNLRQPGSGTNRLRAFDSVANAPALGLARVTIAHAPGSFGFRLDAGVGELPDAYLRFDPAAASNPTLSRALSYVEQAYVTAAVPIRPSRGESGETLSLDAGKFGTPVGLEDNEALTNWSYSRSLLYLLAEPSYHTGARVTYAPTRTLALSGFWVNGWDTNLVAGNGMRTFAGAVTWDPSSKLEIVVDYMGGPERRPTHLEDPALAYRHVIDGYITYDLTDRVSLALTADYGHDGAGGGVSFGGIAESLRVRPLDWLAATLRGEHYEDPDGFTSGARQRLTEVTGTLEARDRVGPFALIGRLEYRRDQSDTRFFETRSDGLSPRQDTLTLSLLTAL